MISSVSKINNKYLALHHWLFPDYIYFQVPRFKTYRTSICNLYTITPFHYLYFNRNTEHYYQIQSDECSSYVRSYKLPNSVSWVGFLSIFFSLKLIGKSTEKLRSAYLWTKWKSFLRPMHKTLSTKNAAKFYIHSQVVNTCGIFKCDTWSFMAHIRLPQPPRKAACTVRSLSDASSDSCSQRHVLISLLRRLITWPWKLEIYHKSPSWKVYVSTSRLDSKFKW